jgi:replication initiation protein RepC
MEQFIHSPSGVTGPVEHQIEKYWPTGWRKPTVGLVTGKQLVTTGERASVPKSKAFVAVKRVGAHMGLKASDMMLLDTLGAFTQAQDWEEGRRPIIWPSNAYLIEQTGFSLSSLKRHARRLAEAGIIAFKDSPNGKRWGRRDADGVILEAYGFDLSPMSARVEEFEHLYAELRRERELCLRLKRQITVARRMIRARIEFALSGAMSGPWGQLVCMFEDLLERLPRRHEASTKLERLLVCFRSLLERVEAFFPRAAEPDEVVENRTKIVKELPKRPHKMDPKGVINEAHTLTTNQLNPVVSKPTDNNKTQRVVTNIPSVDSEDTELEKWVIETRKKRGAVLDLPTIMQACTEFASWAHSLGGYLKDWGDLHRVAGELRPMIGISENAWNHAQDKLGTQVATAALVLVFDKYCSGEVASPGGYLRGIIEKAGAGDLHLERSFYGRLSGKAA